jgi:site-specific recombinase XerD
MVRWPYTQKVVDKATGRVRFRGTYQVDGERKYLPLRESQRAASEEAQDIRRKMRDGGMLAITIGDLANRFLEDIRRNRKPGTWSFYAQQIDAVWHVVPRSKLATLVDAADMRRLIHDHQKQDYSAQTINHRRAVIRRMFRWGEKCGLAGRSPTDLVDWPTVSDNAFDVIASDDLRAMLAQVRAVPEDYDLVVVALYSGLRRGELSRLRLRDIDLSAGVMWVDGKRRKEAVPIDDVIMDNVRGLIDRSPGPWLLPEARADRGPKKPPKRELTPEEDAERARARTVANCFRRWARRIGDRRFHPHTMRHSIATELARADADLPEIGRVLRHRDPKTTMKYVHLVGADARRAKKRLNLLPDDHPRPSASENDD